MMSVMPVGRHTTGSIDCLQYLTHIQMNATTGTGPEDQDGSLIQSTLNWIVVAGINGFGVLPSAKKVASDHLKDAVDLESAIESIINWRTAYAAGSGFVTGVGGIAAMPVAIPAGLLASYALGANTAAAIAYVRGYDVDAEQVRTLILLSLIGESAEQVLKNAGIAIGTKLTKVVLQQIPGKVFIEINKRVGFRLITKAGQKGVVNVAKMVPLVGGVVGAGFDGYFVNACGRAAQVLFSP
jgi:hypothetical protein